MKTHLNKLAILIALLTGCATPPAPTQDIAAIQSTAEAMAWQAITQTALAVPTVTLTPTIAPTPTNTPEPTATPEPAATPEPTEKPTPDPEQVQRQEQAAQTSSKLPLYVAGGIAVVCAGIVAAVLISRQLQNTQAQTQKQKDEKSAYHRKKGGK